MTYRRKKKDHTYVQEIPTIVVIASSEKLKHVRSPMEDPELAAGEGNKQLSRSQTFRSPPPCARWLSPCRSAESGGEWRRVEYVE